ncbi:hypothetical protein [Acinetobacter pittii]|uniref:hypothetical protein n=1 Tax=Acinetobacter pittii TaxID=48296 RepID=UPI001EFD7192|nr:hypothetical protein [Acinetobacter pittii]MCG9505587.1 hypothetical protein [Acinetobacter pittii]
MNRKQKKAKRLKAKAHTQKQAQVYMTPKEKEDICDWNNAYDELTLEFVDDFEKPKFFNGFKIGICLIFCFAIIWMFWHFMV